MLDSTRKKNTNSGKLTLQAHFWFKKNLKKLFSDVTINT